MAKGVSRRDVMQTAVAGAAMASLAGCASSQKKQAAASAAPAKGAFGANGKIRVAVAGIHGQGHGHISTLASMDNVEVVYLADPDSSLFDSRRKTAEEKSGGRSKPKCVQDVRRVLEDDSVDAISIATPNHWHSLMTVWACQAGKHVYVEKPMSHNIHEGRAVVDAARKYNRLVQHGTQSRSDAKWAKIAAVVASGKLGKLLISRGLCYKAGSGGSTRGDIGFKPVVPPPASLDWNIWQGPAKNIDYHENLVHYRWHWFYETGNGDLGNQGVHQMDVARWVIPGATLPKSCVSFGGRLGHYDQGNAASTEIAIMDYGDTQLIFETRGLPSKDFHGVSIGNILHLEGGMIVNHTFYPTGSKDPAPLPEVEYTHGPGTDRGHHGNWIAALRSGKRSDLNAEAIEGHYSSALCHLANISYQLGNKIPFSPKTTAFDNNDAAYETLDRTTEYLKGNGIDVDNSGYTLGRKLIVDAANEKFVNDAEANAMLTRDYRKGFEVPSKV